MTCLCEVNFALLNIFYDVYKYSFLHQNKLRVISMNNYNLNLNIILRFSKLHIYIDIQINLLSFISIIQIII